jgi:hypothetical protein
VGDQRGREARPAQRGSRKKLLARAEFEWAQRSGGVDPSSAKAKLAARNARMAAIKAGKKPEEIPQPKAPELLEENRVTWKVFLAMSTQVIVAGLGSVIGFNYQALPVVLEMLDVNENDWPDVFEKFRVLESYWIARINEATPKPEGKKNRRGGGR